jgi:2-keto-4-pentenoate hydratase/2-oxohepta-3-ene-1,7-dioic acid hydratase in catechol pathway
MFQVPELTIAHAPPQNRGTTDPLWLRILGMKPPQFLKAGDVVTLGIGKIGEQRQKAVPGKY